MHLSSIPTLASQHHLSDYNRLRYGPYGCPVRYSPLSTAFPAHFHALQLRQLLVAEMQTAWLISTQSLDDVTAHLADQLQAAMEEPLTPQTPLVRLKTSMTHPINISCLLPPPSLPLIKNNSVLADPSSPVLLNVPNKYLAKSGPPIDHSEPPPPLPNLPGPLSTPTTEPELSSALEAAISATLVEPCTASDIATATRRPSISLSLSIEIPIDDHSPWTVQSSLQLVPSCAKDSNAISPSTFSIGNLYMSSCPGKKVRLNGPVNGRSAVCRDLGMDMARMKSLGIGCIVCCLDDEELDLLGAPWPAYQKSALALGIDVLRLPIPEGLPPVTPAYLDFHLTRLLQDYTLKGTHVLVHCRGGVGRAGVVACCWLIKLGLCGSVPRRECSGTDGDEEGEKNHFSAAIKFVEDVIMFVRERRNPKAVETYEQVQFLVDYVEFLASASSNTP